MSSIGTVVTPASPKTGSPSPTVISPSSASSCSHCGSLFIHIKGCRYCLPSKNRTNVPPPIDKKDSQGLKKRPNAGSGVGKRESMQCVVPCCTNATDKTPKKNFFFPFIIGNERKTLWLKALGVKAIKTKFAICEEHFELEVDLENYIKYKHCPSKWNKLKKTAVPSKFPCASQKPGNHPKHHHSIENLNKIKLQGSKKREYPDNQSENSVAKKRKVVVSGSVPTSKFGHPAGLRSPSLTQAEIVKDEPRRDKFDFLNGDISTLIAHVQPSICSWDVSVVDVHSPVSSAPKGSVPTCSKSNSENTTGSEINESSDEEDSSETENDDAPSEREQKHLNIENTQIDQTSVTTKMVGIEPKHPEKEYPKVQQSTEDTPSTKQTAFKDVSSCEIPEASKEQYSSKCDDEMNTSGAENVDSELCTELTEPNDGVQAPEKLDETFELPSVSQANQSASTTSEGSIVSPTDDKQNASLCRVELISELVNDESERDDPAIVTISTQDEVAGVTKKIDEIDKCVILVESKLDDLPKLNASPSSEQMDTTSPPVEPISDRTLIIHPSDLDPDDKPLEATSMDCEPHQPSPEKDTAIETLQHTIIDDKTSTPEGSSPSMKKITSNCSLVKVELTKLSEKSSSIRNSNPVETPSHLLTSSRVSDPNCSCVMCGGTSDVAEDDSDMGEGLSETALSPEASVIRENGSQESDNSQASDQTTDKCRAESFEIEPGSSKNVSPLQNPSIPIKRVSKKVAPQSDLSEDLSDEDSPETIEGDSDSEWTPSDEEAKRVPMRTTRSSVRAKSSPITRMTRRAEKTPADESSPSKRVEIDSEQSDEDDGTPANKSSLEVNMSETIGKYSLRKSGTTYSYKQLYEANESNEETGPKRSDKYLVVKDSDDDDFSIKAPLPRPIVDLLENMKTYFDDFFEKLGKLKEEVSKPDGVPSLSDLTDKSNPEATRLAEKYVETLEEDVKKFPALLNLEMVQFVLKCKEHYQKKVEDLGERFKKIRWCAACPEAALFHCCFKAAYCSCKCQKKNWDEHKKDCAQEQITLLDPHLRLNTNLVLRLKNLNRSKVTISDLEKSSNKCGNEELQKNAEPYQPSKIIEKANGSRKEDTKTPVTVALANRKSLANQKSGLKTYTSQPKRRNSTPKTNGSDPEGGYQISDDEYVESKRELAVKKAVLSKRPNKPSVNSSGFKATSKPGGGNCSTISKINAARKNNDNYMAAFSVKQPAVNISLSPQFLSSLSSSSLQFNGRVTTVTASSIASKASMSTASILLPKSMINIGGGIVTSADSSNQFIKFRAVTLPNGEKRLIPADMSSTSVSPSSGKPTTSGSILITRPAKPGYTAQTGFIPLSSVQPSTPPVYLQESNGVLTPVMSSMVSQPPPLSTVLPLPQLTHIPQQVSPPHHQHQVRTLNDDELNKILTTDHLKSAFDDSYYANTRIRS